MVQTRRQRQVVQVDKKIDSTSSSTVSSTIISETNDTITDDVKNNSDVTDEHIISMETKDDDDDATSLKKIVVGDEDSNDDDEYYEYIPEEEDVERMKSIHQINQVGERVSQMVEKYAHQIPNENDNDNDNDNIWYSRPKQIFQELDDTQSQFQEAWSNVASLQQKQRDNHSSSNEDEVIRFREAYMDLMTSAFEEELDAIRQGRILQPSSNKKNVITPDEYTAAEEDMDVDVLIDFLQSGIDIWTKEERFLFLQQLQLKNTNVELNDTKNNEAPKMLTKRKMTPHERHRQFLFGNDYSN